MPRIAPNPLFRLERWCWRHNVRDALIRAILSRQIALSLLTLATGAISAPFWKGGVWLFWFGFGAALSTWNFYTMVKFVQKIIPTSWSRSKLARLLINANCRLLLSLGIFFAAFAWGKAPLSALFLGFATILMGITIAGLKKTLKKPA